MRRPSHWLLIAFALAFPLAGRSLQSPAPVFTLPRATVQPTLAVAIPAALRHESNLEFGYIRLDALP